MLYHALREHYSKCSECGDEIQPYAFRKVLASEEAQGAADRTDDTWEFLCRELECASMAPAWRVICQECHVEQVLAECSTPDESTHIYVEAQSPELRGAAQKAIEEALSALEHRRQPRALAVLVADWGCAHTVQATLSRRVPGVAIISVDGCELAHPETMRQALRDVLVDVLPAS